MKRKLTAAVLSGLVCPGTGQIYNRQRAKGWLLIAATLVIVSAAVYRAAVAAFEVAVSTPPDEILSNIFAIANGIMEANKAYLDRVLLAFAVIWVYGIVDAYINAGDNKSR